MDMEGLSVICAGLGVAEEDRSGNRIGYSKDEYCLDNLKDLLRFLRRDDPQTRQVFKQVCKWNIVSKDLIPIIEHCQDDRNLVLNAVKVLVFLTMPIEPSSDNIPQQIEYLWGLKSSITGSDTVAVIVSLLESPLENLERELFTEDDWKLVQLVLTLFRNILAIQDISLHQKAGGSASHFLSLRDRFLELLFHENVMDLIIVITQHVGGSCGYLRQDNLILLEIFHYVFMGQDPELVAKAHLKGFKVGGDSKTFLDSLKSIMEEEEEKRKLSRLRNISRHSQFSGTFARLTMDGSKAVLKGNPASATHNSLLKPHKGHRCPTKKLVWDHGRLPSTNNILELLHNFVNQFLSGGYNVLMQSICEDIDKEHHAIQNSDIIVFFQVAQFVTSFQYHKFLTSEPTMETDTSKAFADKNADSTLFKGNICGPIAESMNESMFLLVISRWRNAFDGLKETKDFKFLSAAGSLMKTMIHILDLVLKLLPEDSKEPQTARILLYKLFYDQTDQGMTQFLLNLVKTFDSHKQPKSDLADLVEMIHVIVQLMENLQARGTLRVSRKSRKGKKKKALGDKKQIDNEIPEDHVTIQNEIGISNGEPTAELCMSKKESLTNADGKEDISIPFQVDEPEMSVLETGNLGGSLPQMDKKRSDHTNDNFYCSTDDSSGDEQPAATDEVDFKVSTFISAFANCSIIQNLCWLLKFYKSNSTNTNHYIICMLRRIIDDLELSPMLYQLSLLKTFNDILLEQKSCPCKDYENIVNFLTSLVRKMLKKMKNCPLLFVEVLFWKTRKECHYINAENLLLKLGNLKKESGNWGNDSGNGEIGSSHAKGWARRSIADALGEDEADVVISHEVGYQENGGHFGENSDYGGNSVEHEPTSKRKRRLVLNDELENKIKKLYEKFKDDQNCSRLIAESLDPEGKVSAAQVYNKLKQLGLKVAPKKRMHSASEPISTGSAQPGEETKEMESESALHNSIDLEGSSQKQPLNRRKRVCAFNEDQEAMIKALFEQFKDHKRCCYMIANALDPGKTFTAVQVSRKLKQLGLRVPLRKTSEANMHLRDEELNDFTVDEGHESNDETLLSFRNRSKDKDNGRLFSGVLPEQNMEGKLSDDSGDETLSSVLKRRNKDNGRSFGGVLPEQSVDRNLSDDTDDVTLSSVFKKTRKLLPNSEDKRLEPISIDRTRNDENPGNGDTDVIERDGCNQSIGMDVAGIDEDVAFSHDSLEGTLEAEVTGSPVKNVDNLPHQLADDKLADSDDDVAPGASMKNTINRRKLRMVLDLEDDD